MTTFSDLINLFPTASSSQDSCSTICSENDSNYSHFLFTENLLNSVFNVYVSCGVKSKGKILHSKKLFFGHRSNSESLKMNRLSGMLQIDRNIYMRCWHSTSLGEIGNDFSFVLDTLWADIFGYHAELHFHYTLRSKNFHSEPHCSSIDIFDLSGQSIVGNLPLQPFHRNHYQLSNENGWCDEFGNKGIELWVNKKIVFFISTELRSSATFQQETAVSKKGVRVSLGNKPRKQPMKASKTESVKKSTKSRAKKEGSALTVYTSGIRLSAKDLLNAKKSNLSLNPDFHRSYSARILVAKSSLTRSVKLLTILPHIEHIVQLSWLKRYFREGPPALSQIKTYQLSDARRKGTFEEENGFSLDAFLSFPVSERETFLSQFVFWLHHKVEPQDPPLNDIKTVIMHSGGRISDSKGSANVFLLPSMSQDHLKSIHPHLRDNGVPSEMAFAVVPDQLFKCILQQDVALLKSHPVTV